ncbi:acyltransferase [Companilactobacillus jidongensis]|uniref:acyltransferase n=1 Tax=Companilactobacillus jidongensis TaxID=2486006 RepID=UPI000F7B6163|nr:acyltransferase [Companilactobacillus jidongensis]
MRQRQSNFELLRIISMFLIVLHHYGIHGTFYEGTFSWQKVGINLVTSFGKVGVNIFVLISAYFLVTKTFKLERVYRLLLETLFYSYVVLAIFWFFDRNNPTLTHTNIIHLLFPIPLEYWFVNAFLFMLCLSPFLNILIRNISKQMYIYLLLFLTFIWVIVPTVSTLKLAGYSDFAWFIYLYLLAGFLRNYDLNLSSSTLRWIFYGSVAITLLLVTDFNILGRSDQFFMDHVLFFLFQNKLPIVLMSFSLFLLGKDWNLGSNRFINTVASGILGVYLIHDNVVIRPILWTAVNNAQYKTLVSTIGMGIVASIIIYIVCTVIDLIRQLFLAKFMNWLAVKLANGTRRIFGVD